MNRLSCVLFVMVLICSAGCSEFTTTGERSTTVDVVGDPNVPTPESTEKSDIYGAGIPPNDVPETIANAKPQSAGTERAPSGSAEGNDSESEPDVADGNPIAKPVSLKTKKIDSKPSK